MVYLEPEFPTLWHPHSHQLWVGFCASRSHSESNWWDPRDSYPHIYRHAHTAERDAHSPESARELPARPDTHLKTGIQSPNHLAESRTLGFAYLQGTHLQESCLKTLHSHSPELGASLETHRDQAQIPRTWIGGVSQRAPGFPSCSLLSGIRVWVQRSLRTPRFGAAEIPATPHLYALSRAAPCLCTANPSFFGGPLSMAFW